MNFRNIVILIIGMIIPSLFGCSNNSCSGDAFLRDFADASNQFLLGYTNSNIIVAKDSTLLFIEFLEARKDCDEIRITVKSEMAVAYERLAQIYEELTLYNECTLYRNRSKELENLIKKYTGRHLDVTNIVSSSNQWLAPCWLTNTDNMALDSVTDTKNRASYTTQESEPDAVDKTEVETTGD